MRWRCAGNKGRHGSWKTVLLLVACWLLSSRAMPLSVLSYPCVLGDSGRQPDLCETRKRINSSLTRLRVWIR